LLAQAQANLAKGDFHRAQLEAEALLRFGVPKAVRTKALLVAADAAYAMQSYQPAFKRYRQFLSNEDKGPEAARAAIAVGWVEFRKGARARAQRAWATVADKFPDDTRAPLALALAAEVAGGDGNLKTAHVLLDRLVTRYTTMPFVAGARLSRSIILLRRHQERDAVRDLDIVVRTSGATAIEERAKVIAALADPAAEATLVAHARGGSQADGDGVSLDRFAEAFLETNDRAGAPYVLHGLVVLGGETRGWSDALVGTLAARLTDEFPAYPAAPTLLGRVAAAAASAGQWALARRAYESLVAAYPATHLTGSARVDFAESLFRTGAQAEARAQLESHVATAGGAEAPRALLLLAELAEAMGDHRTALAAYDRVLRDHPRLERSTPSLVSHARLLEDSEETRRAGSLWAQVVGQANGEVAGEAAYRLARILSAEKEHEAALEWYMTAAYVAPGTKWAGQGLLGAAGCLTALNQTQDALAIYQKLLPPRAGANGPHDRGTGGEAAYRAAEILRASGRQDAALDMYLTSAHLTAGSIAEGRALVGAMHALVAVDDRASAEAIYRRLLESSATEPELLADARRALRAGSPSSNGGASALPKSVR
jgi:TolA-binding protein